LKSDLVDFLLEQCKERGLSVRGLSLNSGLSPATIHNIVKRKYEPTLYSLNRIADYLGVQRELIWQLAGLSGGTDSSPGESIKDIRLESYFIQAAKLPKRDRDLLVGVIGQLITFLEKK
jgi:lambda repressor-like predicted transcriptional regulator